MNPLFEEMLNLVVDRISVKVTDSLTPRLLAMQAEIDKLSSSLNDNAALKAISMDGFLMNLRNNPDEIHKFEAMVEETINKVDLTQEVEAALEGINLNDLLDYEELTSKLDIETAVKNALEGIDFNDLLDYDELTVRLQ